MVTDEMVKRAATEYLSHKGERPYRVTRRGAELWEDHAPAIRAALEDALSAAELEQSVTDGHKPLQGESDIKPVAWVYAADLKKGDGCFGNAKGEVCMSRDGKWINVDTPIYAAPYAPSVAVKKLDWVDDTIYIQALTSFGFSYCVFCVDWEGEPYWQVSCVDGRYTSEIDAKAAAQAHHDAAIRSALSAQVQDVADTETYYTTENNWENMFFGPGASKTEMDLIWDFAKQNWANADFKIIMTAAPAAKLEEKP